MTLNEFTEPFLTDMGNITMFLTDFLDSDRKDKEIDYMLEYLNDGYKTNECRIKSTDDDNSYESYMATYRVNCNILAIIFKK